MSPNLQIQSSLKVLYKKGKSTIKVKVNKWPIGIRPWNVYNIWCLKDFTPSPPRYQKKACTVYSISKHIFYYKYQNTKAFSV